MTYAEIQYLGDYISLGIEELDGKWSQDVILAYSCFHCELIREEIRHQALLWLRMRERVFWLIPIRTVTGYVQMLTDIWRDFNKDDL